MDIIPTTMVSALTDGDILQMLFVAILFGVALALVGEPARAGASTCSSGSSRSCSGSSPS